MSQKVVVVVGGGAAGFFAAINVAAKHPDYRVTILEKSAQLLGKVKVSGGGRCNVTNGRTLPGELVKFYPRGGKKLYAPLSRFGTAEMRNWLEHEGVKTKTEADLRVFPESNSSQTIIDCFLQAAKKSGVVIRTHCQVNEIKPEEVRWRVSFADESVEADKVVFATGSSSAAWQLLEGLGLKLVPAVPSLFTFHLNDPRIQGLSGVAFAEAGIKVAGTKLEESGPLLITHWGLSGPAVLRLSAWGAEILKKKNYHFTILINWLANHNQASASDLLRQLCEAQPKKMVKNHKWDMVPARYWENLLHQTGLAGKTFGDLGKKQINKLAEELTQARFDVTGKSTFKDEFVTAGGIDLSEIDLGSYECKRYPGLYLAGETLNIDGITGGFNFQACWTAGWIISESIG